MRDLPVRARVFLAAVYLSGVASAACLPHLPTGRTRVDWWELPLFIVLATVFGGAKVPLMRRRRVEDVGSMSLGFAITYAALMHLGPAAAVWVGLSSATLSCLYPRRQPLHQIAFNIALTGVEAVTAGWVFAWLGGMAFMGHPVAAFPAIAASTMTYFAVNTAGVATIIGLCSGQNIARVWCDSFLWTAPGYFAAAGVAALAMRAFGHNIGVTLLFASPVAYLTYYSYAIYASRAEEKQKHIEDLQVSQERLSSLYLATVRSLAIAIDAKDQYTHEHILRVQRYAVATAAHMGLSGSDLHAVETGALLHDIGKLGVPEYVLLKPGRLTEEEFAKVRQHPAIGADILDPVDFPWPVLPVVKHHHERWDGSGYPDGLKGEEIPLTARILAVADVYDALTSMRSYRHAWQHDQALKALREEAGTHFDPAVVAAFAEAIGPVVQEMAREGQGPLAMQPPASRAPVTRAQQAALNIQRASSELWALYEVVQTLSCSLGSQETLEILAHKLGAILPDSACVFMLDDPDGRGLVAREAVGVDRDFLAGCRVLAKDGPSARVMSTGDSYLGPYDAEDLMLVGSPSAQWVPLRTALIVAIRHQGEVLGTINVYHPEPDSFGEYERHFLEAVAERAATALYNSLLYERAQGRAVTDPLTGLHNLRYVTEYVNERCTLVESGDEAAPTAPRPAPHSPAPLASPGMRRGTSLLSLLCVDVDSFKPINDTFGHQKGDIVLRELGRLFRQTVREHDTVARYGGDEFLIVLEGVGYERARATVERLQEAVDTYDPGLGHPSMGPLRVGVSIGCASFPEDGLDFASLLSVADARMYADKAQRRLRRANTTGKPASAARMGRAPERAQDRPPKLRAA